MAGTTGTSQIDQAVERYLAQSRYTLQERPGVFMKSCRNEVLPKNQGPSYLIPKYSTVSTYALTEGVDMAQAQQITDTLMTLTPTEYGNQVVLTDLMLDEARDDFFTVAGRVQGDSWVRFIDQTLADDASNFSVQLGGAASALTVGLIMAAEEGIHYNAPADGTAGRGGEPAPTPYHGVFTPAQLHSLRKTLSLAVRYSSAVPELSASETGGVMGNTQTSFSIPGIEGDISADVNINKDSSDDAHGVFMSEDAWIYVTHGAGPSAEKQRDASLRAWEVNFTGRMARGEYNDGWGRDMLFDSSKPTA